jgi:hypothetical protein
MQSEAKGGWVYIMTNRPRGILYVGSPPISPAAWSSTGTAPVQPFAPPMR